MYKFTKNFLLDINSDTLWKKFSFEKNCVYFKGYLHNKNFKSILKNLVNTDFKGVKTLLNSLDGHFAIICITENYTLAAVDRVRSFPILWAHHNSNLIVSSVADSLPISNTQLDIKSTKSFALAGYTSGDNTLYSNIKQLNPGNFIWFKDKEFIIDKYYEWMPWVNNNNNKDCKDLNIVNENIICKLIKSANGRQIVVPLSAGMDSRFIVSGLKHFKYQNVVCVSYGIKNNKDAYIAKRIADHLEYDWIFIEYSSKLFSKAFKSDDYKNYIKFCDSLTSIHFAGEYLMLSKLKEQNKIDNDAIFVNGQSGDFISGNHIPSELIGLHEITKSNDDLFYKLFLNKHYKHWKNIDTENYNKIIINFLEKELLSLKNDKKNFSYISAYEYIEFKDRQSKYVINGQRTYEYFGYDWRLPLWDNDYLDFWQDVQIDKKINQNLYIRTLKNYNWCGVWDKIDINPYSISPAWIKPIRFILKLFFIFLGKNKWHKFERKYLDYFMTTTCCYGPWSYFKIVFDKRGHDSPIGWIIEHYLNLKNINWKGELIDK